MEKILVSEKCLGMLLLVALILFAIELTSFFSLDGPLPAREERPIEKMSKIREI